MSSKQGKKYFVVPSYPYEMIMECHSSVIEHAKKAM